MGGYSLERYKWRDTENQKWSVSQPDGRDIFAVGGDTIDSFITRPASNPFKFAEELHHVNPNTFGFLAQIKPMDLNWFIDNWGEASDLPKFKAYVACAMEGGRPFEEGIIIEEDNPSLYYERLEKFNRWVLESAATESDLSARIMHAVAETLDELPYTAEFNPASIETARAAIASLEQCDDIEPEARDTLWHVARFLAYASGENCDDIKGMRNAKEILQAAGSPDFAPDDIDRPNDDVDSVSFLEDALKAALRVPLSSFAISYTDERDSAAQPTTESWMLRAAALYLSDLFEHAPHADNSWRPVLEKMFCTVKAAE